MRKFVWLLIGLVTLTSFVHFAFIWVLTPMRKIATDGSIGQLDGLRLTGNSSTLPQVLGALRHYKSLLDNQFKGGSIPLPFWGYERILVATEQDEARGNLRPDFNSGFLLGKGAGKNIDRQSCVIRMNRAPVEGYEGDVGSQTTLRVMSFFMSGVKPEALPPGSKVMVWGLFRRESKLKRALNMTKRLSVGSVIYGQTFEGELEAEELFRKETGQSVRKTKSWISTGWFSMMIALDLCQEIHVYGMVPSDYCTREPWTDFPYHYYNTKSGKECSTYRQAETEKEGAHRFITEKAVFGRWALRYNITFHYPEWTPDQKLLRRLDTPFINGFG